MYSLAVDGRFYVLRFCCGGDLVVNDCCFCTLKVRTGDSWDYSDPFRRLKAILEESR